MIMLALWASMAPAQTRSNTPLILVIEPTHDENTVRQRHNLLSQYLSQSLQRPIIIEVAPNYLAHWTSLRQVRRNTLYLDAVEYTAYRMRKFGYHLLARAPDDISYSLVVHRTNTLKDPESLGGKKIAVPGILSPAAIRLGSIFPNPARQPILTKTPDLERGMDAVIARHIDAIIAPSTLVHAKIKHGAPLKIILSTEPLPPASLSASPDIDADTRHRIRRALLDAAHHHQGRNMLKRMGIKRFIWPDSAHYIGHDRVLKRQWGY